MVTPALVERFNATFDRPSEGTDAPPMLQWCLCLPAAPTAGLGEDGHPARGGFLPPVPLPRRMWAGGEVTQHRTLCIGDKVRRVSRVEDVQIKHGRSGTLCFVTVAHSYTVDSAPAITERQDIVYREAASGEGGAAAREPDAAPQGETTRAVEPSPVLLFRYSALTFNGHRFHYDVDYARRVEGYPGLVVHGPLQATLLALLATDTRGAAARRFSFRSLSPLYDTDDMVLHARDSGDDLDLWTARSGGPIAMQATAAW
ncbi:MaoC family dehydratase N-terminal domain-containing protein [Tepidamorphus sp. 3E244]|uniref:FAS1-like dehydratase domain-containing protein n=1 Tax=Tepidamorphus sp. 3E244 TaxID=3385498 RepID=UPI0038FC363E